MYVKSFLISDNHENFEDDGYKEYMFELFEKNAMKLSFPLIIVTATHPVSE